MSNYTKTTDFEAKDSLPTGDSGKIIRGAEFETEFDAIATAVATKADTAGPTFTGTLTFDTISDGTISIGAFVDEDDMSSNSAVLVPTQQSVKAYVDAQVTAQDLDFQGDSGGALSIDLDSETMTIAGGTGINTSGSGNTLTISVDSSISTLSGSDTLTNKNIDVDNNTVTNLEVSNFKATAVVIESEGIGSNDNDTTLPTSAAVKDYVDSQTTAQDLDFQADSGGALSIDLDSEAITFTGGTGIDTSGSDNAVTFAIDSTVATLTGTQTLTNKTLTAPVISGNLTTDGTIDGRDVATDGTKLDGIEASATADQTDAEIRAAVEAATDSNVFTDADHTKLDGIEALADVTDTINVTAAGALMDSELTNLTAVKSLDQGVATTDTPTFAGLATSANVTFGDNDKAIFGAGSDLQIYHDGSNSYVKDAGTGQLILQGSTKVILKGVNGDNFLQGNEDGAVNLYYNDSQKLATTATGIDVTGTIVGDGLTVNTTNGSSVFEGTGISSVGLQFKTNASNRYLIQTPSATADLAFLAGGTTEVMRLDSSGNVNIGTTAAASGSHKVVIETASTTGTVNSHIALIGDSATNGQGPQILFSESGDGQAYAGGTIGFVRTGSNSIGDLVFGTRSSAGDETTTTTEAMRIDSAGRVGINTSPVAKFDVVMGTGNRLLFTTTGSDTFVSSVNEANNAYSNLFINGAVTKLGTGGTERMRIDASGALLVGKTSADNTSQGVTIYGSTAPGAASFVRDSGNTLVLNRLTTDGEILALRKDGTQVGSIGTDLGRLFIGSDDSMIFFDAGSTNAIWPWKSTATSDGDADNTIDIGDSTNRFKDLYLSGGVYLGGTAAANKLDDYEEGTWTPEYSAATAFTSVTYDGVRYGKYTKVGNLVHIQGILRTDAVNGGSGTVTLTGLPFTVAAAEFASVSVGYVSGFAGDHPSGIYVLGGGTSASIRYRTTVNGGLDGNLAVGDLNTGGNSNYLIFAGTYITTA